MTTDKEKLTALFDELSIGYTVEDKDIVCMEGDANIDGYGNFYTRFEFDDEGKFIQMGAWE